jgi:hypothetical protein
MEYRGLEHPFFRTVQVADLLNPRHSRPGHVRRQRDGSRVFLWFWYSQADVIIAGRLLGKDLLGVYSVAMHLANLPAAKLSALVNQVAFPAFASIQHDRERYAAHFLLAMRLLSFLVFPVLWGMSSVAPELVRVLAGQQMGGCGSAAATSRADHAGSHVRAIHEHGCHWNGTGGRVR